MHKMLLFVTLLLCSVQLHAQAIFLDTSFNSTGFFQSNGTANHGCDGMEVLIQPDGKILVAGTMLDANYTPGLSVYRSLSNGWPDSTFGVNGYSQIPVQAIGIVTRSMALQPDGAILVTGYSYLNPNAFGIVARFTPDGVPDTTFDSDGIAYLDITGGDDLLMDIVLQTDGKILLGGTATDGFHQTYLLARLLSNGAPDTTYGVGGFVYGNYAQDFENVYSISIQADGKLITAGDYWDGVNPNFFSTHRFLTNGNPDTTFGGTGWVYVHPYINGDVARACIVSPNGEIYVGGYSVDFPPGSQVGYGDFAIVKFNPDGSLDSTFDGDGMLRYPLGLSTDVLNNIILQPDGKIVAIGNVDTAAITTPFGIVFDFAVLRLLPNGVPDISFGQNGLIVSSFGPSSDIAYGVAIQPDGKVVVTGSTDFLNNNNMILARYGLNSVEGILEMGQPHSLSVYPNPANNQIYIGGLDAAATVKEIRCFNATGKLVFQEEGKDKFSSSYTFTNQLADGVYLISVKTNEGISTGRFVVMH